MAGNANSGRKLSSTKSVELQKWLALKTEFMTSSHVEVADFLKEKGIEVTDYAYRMASGWRRDKKNLLERAQKRAEDNIARNLSRNFKGKIERRSKYWQSIQEHAMSNLFELETKVDGTQELVRKKVKPFDLLMVAQALEIAIKGERLEDGQPTIIEKIDQVNTHTFRMEELPDQDFEEMERELTIALPEADDDYAEPSTKDSLPDSDAGGEPDQAIPTPPLS